jgi:uncharacterized protein
MHNTDIAKTRVLATQGNADAQYKLGEHYGYDDEELAIEWYRKAAEQGHVIAQYALSSILLSEIYYTKEESEESDKWERMAADGGHPDAQYSVGCNFFSGSCR